MWEWRDKYVSSCAKSALELGEDGVRRTIRKRPPCADVTCELN